MNTLTVTLLIASLLAGSASAQTPPAPHIAHAPHIDYVEPAAVQPHAADPAVIWFDDFDDDERQGQYAEKSGATTEKMRMGSSGKSLHMHYAKGERGKGGRKLFFGDSPTYGNKALRRGEQFEDVYWRIYVKHQAGWQGGGPAKLSRATSMASDKWAQSMIAHVWSSGESLTLDPATGITNGELVTTRYNDFSNLRWLGNKPASEFKIHATEEAGRWVCVEARAKLNTPGEKDGINQLWIDGKLAAERTGLDWRGDFTKFGINAVFLEAYWNKGSPVDQSRWIDHFVVSTQPIGPVFTSRRPVIVKAPTAGKIVWECEVASDPEGKTVVWKSDPIRDGNEVTVDEDLAPGSTYIVRVRQRLKTGSDWSEWSTWHQPFQTVQ